ncbi:glycosyltransferase family 2 protein [Clostridium sp. JNZ X4-2]
MKISACMICKNEEKNIEKCINSYKEVADEIVVVDTGSEDNTGYLAEKLGAKVYDFKWIDDFAAAKNYAIDKAEGDWIIFLDADEYFDKDSSYKIKNILKSINNKKYDAVGCKLINIDDYENIIDSFMQIRIFRNKSSIRYKNNIHEVLSKKNGKLELISYYDELNIYHTGYAQSISKKKAIRNLKLLKKKENKYGVDKNDFRYLCDCYFILKDYENALKYGELHIQSEIKIISYQSHILKITIACMWKLKKPKKEIEDKIKYGIKMFPNHPNFYCSYAFFLIDEKRFEEALNNFLLTVKYNSSYKGIEVNLVTGIVSTVYEKIGFIYNLKNCEEKAIEYFFKSLEFNKYSKDTFESLYNLIKKEKTEDIILFLNSIYDISNEKDIKFIVDQLIKVKPKGALAYYTNIWYKKFNHEDISIVFTFLAEGKYDKSFKLFFKSYIDKYENPDALFSIISLMPSDNIDNIKCLSNLLRPSLKRILKNYIDEENAIYEEDIKDYISILRELILLNNSNVLNKYLKLSNRFSINIDNKIGSVFMNNLLYDQALQYYKRYNNFNENKNTLMNIGYCNYKLRNYKKAYMYIQRAIEMGYNENDAFEILNWIKV